MERSRSSIYAPFFGLDNESFRKWIELQFDEDTSWDNFPSYWQFDHIIPVAYFDFDNDDDMRLCWNFVNIRVEKCDLNKNRGNRVDVLAAKTYFEVLYKNTNYGICKKIVEKIEQIEISQIVAHEKFENFIIERKEYLQKLESFSAYYFDKLNTGTPFQDIVKEIEFLQKFEKKA